MAGSVSRAFVVSLCAGLAFVALPSAAHAQSGWGKPIQAPADPEPAPPPEEPEPPPQPPPAEEPAAPSGAEPNPEWSDAPPTEYEERSAQNPDWVEETQPPPVGQKKRNAAEFYDIRFANRSLVLPRGMIRGTFDTVVGRREENSRGLGRTFGPTGTVSSMNFGFAISLAQDFEIGFSRYRMGSFPDMNVLPSFGFGGEGLITFSLAPEVKFGDIPLYLRFQAVDREVVKLAFDAVFRIPVRTPFGFVGGVPVRFIIQEQFSFDTGVQFEVTDNRQGPAIWGMNIPFTFNANATDQLFFQLLSGMNFFDLGQTIRTVTSGLVQGPFYFIPLGATVGYAFEGGSTMMDAFVSFRFPALYGFTTRESNVNSETWQFIIGFNIHSPVLFKGSAL
jgi:hypothetical protein